MLEAGYATLLRRRSVAARLVRLLPLSMQVCCGKRRVLRSFVFGGLKADLGVAAAFGAQRKFAAFELGVAGLFELVEGQLGIVSEFEENFSASEQCGFV